MANNLHYRLTSCNLNPSKDKPLIHLDGVATNSMVHRRSTISRSIWAKWVPYPLDQEGGSHMIRECLLFGKRGFPTHWTWKNGSHIIWNAKVFTSCESPGYYTFILRIFTRPTCDRNEIAVLLLIFLLAKYLLCWALHRWPWVQALNLKPLQ